MAKENTVLKAKCPGTGCEEILDFYKNKGGGHTAYCWRCHKVFKVE